MASAQALIAQQRPRTPVDIFMGKVLTVQDREEMQRALPRHVPFDRFERNLVNAVMNEPKLLGLEPRLVCREAMKIAALGLLIDAQLGEAYLIAGRTGPQARIGYRGLLKLARQSGQVAKIYAEKVHANDKVAGKLGTNKFLEHEPDFFGDRGEIVGFYAVIVFRDGETDFEAMNVHEVNAIRDRSDGWKAFKAGAIKDTPWHSSYEEMGRKTTIRRLLKRSPQSPDLVQAFEVEDQADHPQIGAQQQPRQLTVRNPLADQDDAPAIAQSADLGEQVDPETGEVTGVEQHQDEMSSKATRDPIVQHHTINEHRSGAPTTRTGDPAAEQRPSEAKPADKPRESRSEATPRRAQRRDASAPATTMTEESQASAAVGDTEQRADTAAQQLAEPASNKGDAVEPLVGFTKGCAAAKSHGELESLRQQHKAWFAAVEGKEDFKIAERAYAAAVNRLDDEERARSEEEAKGDPEASAGPDSGDAKGSAEASAEARQISMGGERSEPVSAAATPGDRIGAPETWEDLIPNGDFNDRELKSLRNCAKELFKTKSLTEVRDVEDGYREVMKLKSESCQAAYQHMIAARQQLIRDAFKPGE